MKNENEIIKGTELTDEEKEQGVVQLSREHFELSDDELADISGGVDIKISRYRKVFCPWCNCYEDCGDCGRISGTFGKAHLTNMPLWWCKRKRRYFLGPSAKGRYYAWDGRAIR